MAGKQGGEPVLDQSFLETLISIGAREVMPSDFPDGLPRSRDAAWPVVMCGVGPWLDIGERYDEAALAHLIRGLVLYMTTLSLNGGSVSPVTYLFREYEKRFPEGEPRLAEWIVRNTRNGYEPFGGYSNLGATSRRDYEARHREMIARNSLGGPVELERKAVARARKAERATSRLESAVRRADLKAVQGLLVLGADWRRVANDVESLIALAESSRCKSPERRKALIEFLRSLGIT